MLLNYFSLKCIYFNLVVCKFSNILIQHFRLFIILGVSKLYCIIYIKKYVHEQLFK